MFKNWFKHAGLITGAREQLITLDRYLLKIPQKSIDRLLLLWLFFFSFIRRHNAHTRDVSHARPKMKSVTPECGLRSTRAPIRIRDEMYWGPLPFLLAEPPKCNKPVAPFQQAFDPWVCNLRINLRVTRSLLLKSSSTFERIYWWWLLPKLMVMRIKGNLITRLPWRKMRWVFFII